MANVQTVTAWNAGWMVTSSQETEDGSIQSQTKIIFLDEAPQMENYLRFWMEANEKLIAICEKKGIPYIKT